MNRFLHISQTLAKVAELVNELANEFNQLAHDPVNETQLSLFPSITEERPKPEPEPEITIDVVRSKLKDVAVKVSAPRAKQILADAGATSVGELEKAKYAQVVSAAEEALT